MENLFFFLTFVQNSFCWVFIDVITKILNQVIVYGEADSWILKIFHIVDFIYSDAP